MTPRTIVRTVLMGGCAAGWVSSAAAQPGPFCGGPVVENCIVSVSSTNPATPGSLGAQLIFNAGTGVYTVMVLDGNSVELGGVLTPNSIVTVVIRLSNAVRLPKFAVSTGLVNSWTINQGVTPREITLVASPRATSWAMTSVPEDESPGGCTPTFCEQGADVDYNALLLAAFDPMTTPSGAPPEFATFAEKFNTGYIATNAQYFSPIPNYNAATKAIDFQVGAPHFKKAAPGNVLNTGFVRLFVPDPVIVDLWGIAGGSDQLVADPSLTTVTVGGAATSFVLEDTPTGAIFKVGETTPFGFSVPQVVVKPAVLAPTLTGVSPNTGTIAGGTSITLTGTNFSGATVKLGGSAATNVVVVNSTTITALTPARAAGVVDVMVTNSNAQSATLAASYTYVNTTPMISAVAAQTINEDTALAPVDFIVGDLDTATSALVVTATSSNSTLASNQDVVLGGSGANRTVVVRPNANRSGTTTITLQVSDGTSSATTSFVLTVLPVNDPPTISSVSTQTGPAGRVVGPLAVTVGDIDNDASSLTLSATTSNSAVVSAVTLGGSGASRTVTAQTLANAGSTTITLTVSDGALSASTSFSVVSTAAGSLLLTATADGSLASFSWTTMVGGDGVTSYRVEVGAASGATSMTFDAGPSTAMAATTIGPGTWFARVRARDANGNTVLLSNEITFVLSGAPSRPRNLIVGTAGNSVTFSWQLPLAGTPTSYLVEVGTAAGTANVTVATVAAGLLTFSAQAPAGSYFARVKAVNGAGASSPSNEAAFAIGSASGVPGPPQNLQAAVAGNALVLTWVAPAFGGAPDSYLLEVGFAAGQVAFAIPVNGTSFANNAVPNGAYFVRVRALNGSGTGAASNEVSLSVPAPAAPPGSPSGLVASVTGNTVTLMWLPPSTGGAATGYAIVAGTAPGLSDLGIVAFLGPQTTFSSTAPSGTFYVRVVATNPAGVSAPSNEVVVGVP